MQLKQDDGGLAQCLAQLASPDLADETLRDALDRCSTGALAKYLKPDEIFALYRRLHHPRLADAALKLIAPRCNAFVLKPPDSAFVNRRILERLDILDLHLGQSTRSGHADLVVHPVRGHALRFLKLIPVLVGARAKKYDLLMLTMLLELKAFLLRELGPSLALQIEPIECLDAPDTAYRRIHESGSSRHEIKKLRGRVVAREEVLVVGFATSDRTLPIGLGGDHHIVFQLPYGLWYEGLLAHEFGHAVLGLHHTDGQDDVEDRLSVMGKSWFMTYFNDGQRQRCLVSNRVHELASEGERLLGEGRWQGASRRLTKALSLAPKQARLYLPLCDAWLGRGRLERALAVLEQASQMVGSVECLQEVATRYLRLGRDKRATEILQTLSKVRQSLALKDAGRYAQALGLRAQGDRLAADLLWQMGFWSKAARWFRKSLADHPDRHSLHLNLMVCAAARGRWSEAERRYRLAQQAGVADSVVSWWRQRSLRLEGRWLEASRLQVQNKPAGRSNAWWLDLAYCWWAGGKLEKARKAFDRAIRAQGPLLPKGRIARAWLRWLSDPHDPDLPREAGALVRLQPYSVPALHLLVLVCPGHCLTARLKRLSPASPLPTC